MTAKPIDAAPSEYLRRSTASNQVARGAAALSGVFGLVALVLILAILWNWSREGDAKPIVPSTRANVQDSPLVAGESTTVRGRQPVPGAADRSPPSVQDLAGCTAYLEDEAEFLTCIRTMLGRSIPSPRELGRTICNGPDAYAAYVRLLGETLLRIPPGQAIRFVGDVQLHCDRYRETPIHMDALAWSSALDPEWFESVKRVTAAAVVFDPSTSEGAVQALQFIAGKGDERTRVMIEAGGRGDLGGSGPQVLRAAMIALAIESSPVARLNYVRSLLASSHLARGELLGCQIAHQLASSGTWPDGDCEPALSVLCEALEDPRIRSEVAAQLARGENSPIPARGRELWSHVIALRDRVLSMPR